MTSWAQPLVSASALGPAAIAALVALTLAVLAQLRARANWHRIAREWMYGDEPVTELGRAEARFYGTPRSERLERDTSPDPA